MATSTTADLDYRPSYRAALVVSLVTLVLYLLTLAPSTAMWDTSEYIAAAYTLGIPHPPGNPLFVILGRVFAILPIASGIAVRINIISPICSAASAGMWCASPPRRRHGRLGVGRHVVSHHGTGARQLVSRAVAAGARCCHRGADR